MQTYRRIVRVDLKFPEKPAVSEGAKDFVRKVSQESLVRVQYALMVLLRARTHAT